eukprot:jgi/Bigna1/67010/fgenesh1_pg.2_\
MADNPPSDGGGDNSTSEPHEEALVLPNVFDVETNKSKGKKKNKGKRKKRKDEVKDGGENAPGKGKKRRKKKKKKKTGISLPSADLVVVPEWDVTVESSGDEIPEEDTEKHGDAKYDVPKRARRTVSTSYNNIAPPASLSKIDEDEAFRLKPCISRRRQEELDAKAKKKKNKSEDDFF